MQNRISEIAPYDENEEQWRVVIETPRGSHSKYKFDEKLGQFILNSILPEGMAFPYDFGFLPSTVAADGDPTDVLVLMTQPAFPGCVVLVRLIGVIEAQQTEQDGTSERNDRLVAVLVEDRTHGECKTVKDLNKRCVKEIEQFFVTYNRLRGKKFKLLGLHGPAKAESLAREGMHAFAKRHRTASHANGSKSKKTKNR